MRIYIIAATSPIWIEPTSIFLSTLLVTGRPENLLFTMADDRWRGSRGILGEEQIAIERVISGEEQIDEVHPPVSQIELRSCCRSKGSVMIAKW